jgi:thiosulfate dehydrogenase
LIRYGRSLIVNTSYYYGPRGRIGQITNGLNCQNCHLNAGTKAFGSNFATVSTRYPTFKERSGSIETINNKIEDCFERSLNGKQIDSNSREMKAMVAYLQWLGKDVKKGSHLEGSGIEELPFLNRPADIKKGEVVYTVKCKVCHGANGQGQLNATGLEYTFPPLWGPNSYNIGASMYRLSKFAGYVKNSMPLGVNRWQRISNEDAWDVAAFVNSKSHPFKDVSKDWPKLASKPFDYPFGPYADSLFLEKQRKYGPFKPIKDHYALLKEKH